MFAVVRFGCGLNIHKADRSTGAGCATYDQSATIAFGTSFPREQLDALHSSIPVIKNNQT